MRLKEFSRNYRETRFFLRLYTRKYQGNYNVFGFGWLVNSALSIIIPALMGTMIDELIYYRNRRTFLSTCGVLASLIVFSCILQFFIYAQHQFLNNVLTHDIKYDVLTHLYYGRACALTELNQGDVLNTVQTYTSECLQFTIRNIVHFFVGLIKLAMLVVTLFLINWQFGLVIMFVAPIHVVLSSKFGEKARFRGERQREVYSNYNSWLLDIISNTREIRQCNAHAKKSEELIDFQNSLFREENRTDQFRLATDNSIALLNLLIRLIIYSLATIMTMNGNMTIGRLTIIFALIELLIDQIKWSSSSFVDAQRRIAYINHVRALLAIPLESDPQNSKGLFVKEGTIDFKNVSFSYPSSTKETLHNLNLQIAKQQKIGIMGESGSGKTTLINILLGLYAVDSGVIYIDGQDIGKCSVDSIRRHIGIVSQEVLLLNSSIRNNMLVAKADASDDEIIEACNSAGLKSYLELLPNGIYSDIGMNGSRMSGGERQRLAIARVLLKNPRIVVFDEATSALDKATEKALLDSIFGVMTGRTVIFVSHNPEPLARCDRVFTMTAGNLCELTYPAWAANKAVVDD